MTRVTSPEQLFVHELQDVYFAEKALTKVLPTLVEEATDRELRNAFKAHLRETEQHVTNLEQVFEQIGEPARARPCPGIEGIKKEHDEFVRENREPGEILDLFLTGAGARTEHYEIAAYTGLVGQARALRQTEAAKLLSENLDQEKGALKTVETISKRMLKGNGNGSSRSRSTSKPRNAASPRARSTSTSR